MSIFLNKDSKVIVQGITGGEGNHASLDQPIAPRAKCGTSHLR